MNKFYYYFIQKILPCVYGRLIKVFSSLLTMTYSYKFHGFDAFNERACDAPAILALWHQKLIIIPSVLSKYTSFSYAALVSKSKEGEILSQVIKSYKKGKSVRIPHNAKSAGLIGAIDAIKDEHRVLVITPDGPRGPAKQVKGGIFTIAKNADALIFPINWTSNKCWRLNTWDKMEIPKPFSRVTISIGKALQPDEYTSLILKMRIDKEEDKESLH